MRTRLLFGAPGDEEVVHVCAGGAGEDVGEGFVWRAMGVALLEVEV